MHIRNNYAQNTSFGTKLEIPESILEGLKYQINPDKFETVQEQIRGAASDKVTCRVEGAGPFYDLIVQFHHKDKIHTTSKNICRCDIITNPELMLILFKEKFTAKIEELRQSTANKLCEKVIKLVNNPKESKKAVLRAKKSLSKLKALSTPPKKSGRAD